jgi:hypothetical protein
MKDTWRHGVAPFALALYPVLFLYAHNQDQTYFSEVTRALTATVLGTGAILGVLWLAYGDLGRAAALTSLVVVLFFAHGHILIALGAGSAAAWTALGVEAALVAAAAVVLARQRRTPDRIMNLVSIASVCVLVLPTASILVSAARRMGTTPVASATAAPANGPAAGPTRPDIYYIVLDSYAAQSSLAEFYDYDNRPFVDALRERGFFVAENSRSNYKSTLLSLSSTLNMAYLDEMTAPYRNGGDTTVLMDAVRDNAVVRTLKAHGYSFVNIASGFSGTDPMPAADVELRPRKGYLNEFELLLTSTTVLATAPVFREVTDEYLQRRVAVQHAFDALGNEPETDGPKFVLAHVLNPHPPFVFDRDGNVTKEIGGRWEKHKEYSRAEYFEGYRGQVDFVNPRVLAAVDRILARYPKDRPPVILIQGDHGPSSLKSEEADAAAISREQYRILNAYLVPPDCQVRDTISPVNSFRVLFSCLFGEPLAPLPDESYTSTFLRPYEFKRVD